MADGIRLNGSTRGVASVVQLDGRAAVAGAPGEAWQQMSALLQGNKQRLCGAGGQHGGR
jgi:branched-subunit amino acid aminotransferase/4-amino-4-deoxychorismate lyase